MCHVFFRLPGLWYVDTCKAAYVFYSFFISLLKSGHGNLNNKKKSKPRKSKLMHEDVHQPLNLSSTNTKVFINGWNRTHPDPTHWHGVVWTKTCQDVTLQYLCLWHFCLFFFSFLLHIQCIFYDSPLSPQTSKICKNIAKVNLRTGIQTLPLQMNKSDYQTKRRDILMFRLMF